MPAGTKYNYTLAIQQQIGQRSVVEVSYVGSQGGISRGIFNSTIRCTKS